MGYLKGKSTLMIFDRHANLKIIREYIQTQTEEDYMSDQISFKEYMDPFTGSKNK